MKTSEKVDKILPALAVVKVNLGKVIKGANNPYFKSKYADLNTHLEVVEPVLEENGLVLFQPATSSETGNVVESVIYHAESGQFVSSSMTLVGESDMQKAGSAVTYARRYTLGSLLSMQAVDDDGEGAMTRNQKTTNTKSSAPTSSAPKSTGLRKPKAKPSTSSGAGLSDI